MASATVPNEADAGSITVQADEEPPARESQAQATREGRELILASKPFAEEDRRRTLFHVVTTFGALAVLIAGAVALPLWPLQALCSVVAGGVVVRGFILYHDFLHGAILRKSTLAKPFFTLWGLLLMTPRRVWKETHNYHHAHTAKLVGSHIGSYQMVSTLMWKRMTPAQKRLYKAMRHPFTILFGFFTIFMVGMCLASFKRAPRKNWDSLLAVVLHLALAATLWSLFGFEVYFFGLFLPLFVAMALGAYLFYAQHNYPEVDIRPRPEWSYTHAALESSSYMEMGPVMAWFCGNIGYHHVHHLNPQIPFYRLPEAMAAIPELQQPGTTSLRPRDIVTCFRLKLWDPRAGKMVGYPD